MEIKLFLVRGTVLDNGFASKGRDMFNNSMIALGLEPNRVSKFDQFISKHLPNLISEGYQIEGLGHSLGGSILLALAEKYPQISMTLYNPEVIYSNTIY